MQFAMFPEGTTPTILVATAILATIGWIYTARRARHLARKQHTINILLKGNFDPGMREAHKELTPIFRGNDEFPAIGSEEYNATLQNLRFILNHFEFIAAGIRRGDIDEKLVMDAQRGTILTAFEKSEAHIYSVRTNRRNQAVYEHLEWLHKRWEKKPPNRITCFCERAKGSPIYGKRHEVRS